jgi:aspartate-semialdehyde dehydrogenase
MIVLGSIFAMSTKIPVGVLGATGAVGQKFIKLLEDHPWFEVAEVAASERTSGKLYGEAVSWKQTTPIPRPSARWKFAPVFRN